MSLLSAIPKEQRWHYVQALGYLLKIFSPDKSVLTLTIEELDQLDTHLEVKPLFELLPPTLIKAFQVEQVIKNHRKGHPLDQTFLTNNQIAVRLSGHPQDGRWQGSFHAASVVDHTYNSMQETAVDAQYRSLADCLRTILEKYPEAALDKEIQKLTGRYVMLNCTEEEKSFAKPLI